MEDVENRSSGRFDPGADSGEDAVQEEWLNSIADRVVALRMQSAVEFLIESHLPLTAVLHTAGLVAQPLVSPVFGAARVARLQALLADRQQVEKLLALIRAKSEH